MDHRVPVTVPFSIQYGWRERELPRDLPEEYAGSWPPLFRELARFLAGVDGEFVIRIGQAQLDFELSPDLSTVFENLPHMLARLTRPTTAPVGLHFFAQGTDLLLMLMREGDSVRIELHAGASSARRFRSLDQSRYVVDAAEFLLEWIGFIRAILDAMKSLRPEFESVESYRTYVAQLAAIEAEARKP